MRFCRELGPQRFKMRKSKGYYLLWLLLCFCYFICPSSAQVPNLKFEHITSENGLPHSTIHGIVKDKYGFMWFGTWGGLCRYDGYSFKIYRYDPAKNRSINNNRIHNVLKDKDQNIWVLTFQENELCRYNYEKDDFDRISTDKVPAAFVQLLNRRNHNSSVQFSYKQYKWNIDSYSNSLLQKNLNTGETKYYQNNYADRWSLSDPYVTDIYKDNQDILWVATYNNGINKANLNAKPFEYYYHNPLDRKTIIDNNIRAICEDNTGNLWVGTRDKGLTIIGKDSYKHINAATSNILLDDQIKRIFCDSKGIIWIGSKKGLSCFNPATGVSKVFADPLLNNVTVFGIGEDEDKNLWFASWRGVFKYVRIKDKLIYFNPDKILRNKHTRTITQDRRGHIWVGTEGGGISVLQMVSGSDSVKLKKQFLHQYKEKNSISDDRINCIYEDREGLIWIGTGNGLDRYDPVRNSFTHFSARSGLADATVAGITEDDNGFLWISHKKGIFKLNKKTLKVRQFTIQDGLQSNEFSDGAVLKSRFRNRLYFGGNNGFNGFNPDSIFTDSTLPSTVLTELQILNHKVTIGEEVNGRIILTKPLYLTPDLELNYDDKSVAFEFAALHYSNSKENKYAYKLEGFDTDWVYTNADSRIAKYSNLEPGDYIFKVISSNSDGIWNLKPASIHIKVHPPFWASTWAYVLYIVLILVLAYVYHYYATKFTRLKAKLSYELLIREKENELHQNKLQFFTNISHEIKTPLTLILAPVEKLVQQFCDNRAVANQLATMKVNGDRLLKLVNQLLDFRKLETGNLELKTNRNDLVAFLDEITKSFAALSEAKGIKLEFIHEEKSFYLLYDEDKLEKVIANLLSNAFKFTPSGAWIRIVLRREKRIEGDFAILEVINPGSGVTEEDKERIFKPFKQGSGNKEGGTGLGLAFSKGLVELHGGTISVTSEKTSGELNETTFIIELPLVEGKEESFREEVLPIAETEVKEKTEDETVVDELIAIEPQSAESRRERILINGKIPLLLIVEDSDDLRKYLKAHFDPMYQILEAQNGREGLEIASENLPDLIVSDVMMPEMNGFEFCNSIKTNVKTAHIPVVLLTARTPMEDQIEGIETGADDYITKPFNLAYLSARIKNILLTRTKLKERYRKEISLQPTESVPVSHDEKLLKKVLQYVEERISDPELNIEAICSGVGLSRTHLYRKIKALTGLSMAEMVKEIRLKRAKQLLKDRKFNVNEVTFMVGFSDADYFRKCFKAEFGITPSEYSKLQQEAEKEW